MEPLEKKIIFIVDDDIIYLELLKNELTELKNIEVETFTSAEKCLEKMYKKPDLIILDFYLDTLNPENMNGHNALKEFYIENPKQKIVFISSSNNEFLLEEYKRYRSVDFIVKTDSGINHLQQLVKYHLKAA
jgi:two-component system OmpR family response regulator